MRTNRGSTVTIFLCCNVPNFLIDFFTNSWESQPHFLQFQSVEIFENIQNSSKVDANPKYWFYTFLAAPIFECGLHKNIMDCFIPPSMPDGFFSPFLLVENVTSIQRSNDRCCLMKRSTVYWDITTGFVRLHGVISTSRGIFFSPFLLVENVMSIQRSNGRCCYMKISKVYWDITTVFARKM